ncbi:hypothetical protein [Cohaesibacter marisflavi]|uniref:hypothetical protein n=1 Tax=Cohaesibacter marisflavi TaxID=655353 RepID=UPI0029C7C61F|nr:hypothetical protein [Cohaesibacter marisflavi]
MIAIIMYILLGVFVTLLLMLLVVPMIWRRAVRLTQKRLVAEIPISYNELQAEKDHIRAEMAVDMRRLEVISNRRQDELANQTIKIDRLNATLEKRDSTIEQHEEELESLKSTLSDQKAETDQISDLLQDTKALLAEARQAIANLETDKVDLNKEIYYLETNVDEQKVELAAQMARIENLRDEISSLSSQLTAQTNERSKAESLLGQRTNELERTKERLTALQDKVDGLQADLADRDSKIDTLSIQLDRANQQSAESGSDSDTLLAEAETRRMEAEAKIANLAMQLETQQKLQDGENLSNVINGLEKEKQVLQDELDKALANNEDLATRLDALEKQLQDNKGEEIPSGPLTTREQILRDEIKQIASRLSEFTTPKADANDDSEDTASVKAEAIKATVIRASQISERVERTAANLQNASEASNSEASNTDDDSSDENSDDASDQRPDPKSAKQDPWSQVFSLADQVRELEKSSN